MARWGPHRVARRDLSAISASQARTLLREFAAVIESEVRFFAAWGANVGLEPDDLRQIARVAALEASLSHRGSRATLRTWVNKTVRWRLTEALTGSERPEEALDTPNSVLNGQSPEEILERLQTVRWVRSAVDGLAVRQRTIIACRLRGESMREIAVSLGISSTRVHQESSAALDTLRQRALDDRLDEEYPES